MGAFSFLLSLTMGVFYEIPAPAIHDEFGHLLVGDTIAAGRITNSTHPMWEHFETFHVFHSPTYQARYPPGQGLFLAFGKVLADLPILGVWISLALAHSAICWTLLAFFPRAWCLYGSMLAVANPHLFLWWGQSYWGGAVAMLGGALLFGSAFRLPQRLLLSDTVLLGLGLFILANSRPLEGAITAVAASPLIVAGVQHRIGNGQWKRLVWIFVLPLLGIGILLVAWLLFYNYQLTGAAFRWPYYNWHPHASSHELIRSYRGSEPLPLIHKVLRPWYFFVTPILSPFVLGLALSLKDRKVVSSLAACIPVIVVSLAWTRAWPHYLAPIYCLVMVLIVHGLRALSSLQIRHLPAGRVLVLLISTAYFANSAWLLLARLSDGPPPDGSRTRPTVEEILQEGDRKELLALFLGMVIYDGPPRDWGHIRSTMTGKLENQAAKDLVVVRYSPSHDIHHEWVFNTADIDRAEVVWARELSPERNKHLFDYFRDRKIWLLLADATPPRLLPYFDLALQPDGKSSNKT